MDTSRSSSSRVDKQGRIASAWKVFAEYLREHDHRVTKTRRFVVEHVMGRDDHFRADEVAVALATGEDRVSRATVYKTLALMLRVGQACGANPVPLLVPCHRVLAAAGKLGGFSGELARKRLLLMIEAISWQ